MCRFYLFAKKEKGLQSELQKFWCSIQNLAAVNAYVKNVQRHSVLLKYLFLQVSLCSCFRLITGPREVTFIVTNLEALGLNVLPCLFIYFLDRTQREQRG